MASFKKTLKYLSAVLFVLLFSKCANQLPPSGGEVDSIPPAVLEVIPKNGTTNFSGNSIEITFSEYVLRQSVQENVFISPKIMGGMEFDWSGRTLEIIFSDSLKKNTTYSVTIGADVTDINNNNKMNEAYSFAFSTGGNIDSCRASGKVYDQNPAGTLIFAFRDKGDTLNISKTSPDYISQVGKNGNFLFTGLGYGEYLFFAINDKMRDYLYGAGEDKIGIPSEKVIITREKPVIEGIDFFLSVEDSVKPHISKVTMTDRNHIAVEFSKEIDSTQINASNFYLYDSTSNKKTEMNYFYKGQGKPYQFFLAFSDSISNSSSLFLNALKIVDKKGNILDQEANSVVYNQRPDTSAIKILKLSGQYQNDLLDFETPEIFLQFDDGFSRTGIDKAVIVEDSRGKPVDTGIEFIDDSSLKIAIKGKVRIKGEYNLKLNLKDFKDIGGKYVDSMYQKKFTIINDIDFSGASGTVNAADSLYENYVVLEKAEREKKSYIRKADKKGNFEIKKVEPGKYLVWTFKDTDKNKKYSNGRVNPLIFSEKFKFYSDTLNLRARWPVGEIIIK